MHVDLGLSTTQYNTAVAVLFAGYVALQIPSNMVASKISVPGICELDEDSSVVHLLTCTRHLRNVRCVGDGQRLHGSCPLLRRSSRLQGGVGLHRGSFLSRRELIASWRGFALTAQAIFLLSIFYEKKQMAFRTAILYSGSQVGNAFGGLFALAILQMHDTHGIEGWRWLFIVEGVMSKRTSSDFSKGNTDAVLSRRARHHLCLHHSQSTDQHPMAHRSREGSAELPT